MGQQIEEILRAVSEGSTLRHLIIWGNFLVGTVEAGLLGGAVTRLESLDVGGGGLSGQQIEEILRAVSEGSTLRHLIIWGNTLMGTVEAGLLGGAVNRLESLDVRGGGLSAQQH